MTLLNLEVPGFSGTSGGVSTLSIVPYAGPSSEAILSSADMVTDA